MSGGRHRPPRHPPLDEADAEAWDRVAETVAPLDPADAKPEADDEATFEDLIDPDAPRPPARPGSPPAPAPPPPRPPARPNRAAPLVEGAVAGVDKRSAQRLTRGRWAIDARVDLHGMTLAQAHETFRRFVDEAARRGARCVLVITGKGSRARDGIGVIRAALPDWINEPDVRKQVLSFTKAQPKDGGSGAFYILLKKQRDVR